MASNFPDLWPDDITVDEDVLTPYAVLEIQARNLERRAKGLINAEITRGFSDEGEREVLRFALKAPVLGYTYELLSLSYKRTQVYPVTVNSPAVSEDGFVECYTQEGLEGSLRAVFGDSETRAIITSILAQSKDHPRGAPPPRAA